MNNLIELFITEPNKLNQNNFKLTKFLNQVNILIDELNNTIDNNKFINKYEFIYMCFGYYINYLEITKQNYLNIIDEFNNFRYDKKFIKRIYEIKPTNKLIQLINPFINLNISVKRLKQYDELLIANPTQQKMMNIILYRYIYSNCDNYNTFFINTFNMESHELISNIPSLLPIMEINNNLNLKNSNNNNNNNNINVPIQTIIYHVINAMKHEIPYYF